MSDVAGGIAALAVMVAVVGAPIALALHHRSPEEVVTAGSTHGRRGMAIHPWRGHRFLVPVAWVVALGVTALGASFLRSSLAAAVFFLGAGLFMLYLGWCRATGRAGDGTLTLTPDGIHQLWAGSEVFVPWDDVRGLVTTPKDFVVRTAVPVVPAHRMPALLSRRSVVMDDAISLPRRTLPPLPFQQMIEAYSTSPVARDELGTDAPIHRARAIVSAVPRAPVPVLRVTAPAVRWVVELGLQLIGWALLAIGAGSLYLIVTTASAPTIDSTPVAVVMVLGAALLIWLTRRSLYKKQYRDHGATTTDRAPRD